jgi:hypothetical protein
MKRSILFILLLTTICSFGQQKIKKVLFIGNSYIYVNDLPKMLAEMAKSTGDSLIYESNTIGGSTLKMHSTDATTIAKIATGKWDYVVLQDQSQFPSFPISQVQQDVYPYAKRLDSMITSANPCTETVFYMTWGRKNGDASNCTFWPPVCTYIGMDSMLRLRYTAMANDNNAIIAPAGPVWNKIRKIYPTIELYNADESHPSVEGTYAAAASFYTAIFRKNPQAITYHPSLDSNIAKAIRQIARQVAFDSLENWNIGKYDSKSSFVITMDSALDLSFVNRSINADTYHWSFGDNLTSTTKSPKHHYVDSGQYTIRLVSERCGLYDTAYKSIVLIKKIDTVQTKPNLSLVNIDLANNTQNIWTIPADMNDISYIEIFNNAGVLVAKITDFSNQTSPNIHLPKGMYYVQIKRRNNVVEVSRFVLAE